MELNVLKTKEMITDFRRKKTQVCPISINGVIVGQVLDSWEQQILTISIGVKMQYASQKLRYH